MFPVNTNQTFAKTSHIGQISKAVNAFDPKKLSKIVCGQAISMFKRENASRFYAALNKPSIQYYGQIIFISLQFLGVFIRVDKKILNSFF